MKYLYILLCIFITVGADAQEAVTEHPDQLSLLMSDNHQEAANKQFVYEFWLKVLEGGDVSVIPDYVAEEYIQHNPNVPSGRAPFIKFIKSRGKPEVKPTIIPDLVMLTADADIVTLAFRVERQHPAIPERSYTTTWFDMFRIEDGKIVEHWDSANIWH